MGKNLVIGFILIVVALGMLFYLDKSMFLEPAITLVKGAIPLFIAFVGLIFLLIGWDELTAPKFAEKPAKPKKRR